MEAEIDKVPLQDLIDYHKWWVENKLSLYEKIASKLWPPTDSFLDSFVPILGSEIREEQRNGKTYKIVAIKPDTLTTNIVLLEGVILHLTAIWEKLVTNTIVALFAWDTSHYSRRLGYRLEKTIAIDEATAIIIGDSYLDFKSFAQIKSAEGKFLAQNLRPFSHAPKEVQKVIDEMYIVRNYIAHQSIKSERDYRQKVLVKYSIKDFLPIGDFLLSSPSQGDTEDAPKTFHERDRGLFFHTRRRKRIFEMYIDALRSISEKVVEYLEKAE